METASPCGNAPTVGACSKEEEEETRQIYSTPADTSNVVALICSVPQDSVVGPVLFIAFTEDIEDFNATKDYIYTDDSQLLALAACGGAAMPKKSQEMCVSNPSLVHFEMAQN